MSFRSFLKISIFSFKLFVNSKINKKFFVILYFYIHVYKFLLLNMFNHICVIIITFFLNFMKWIFDSYYTMKFKITSKKIFDFVNYHLIKQCNYFCDKKINVSSLIFWKIMINFISKFCFHTIKTSFVEFFFNAKKIMTFLKKIEMKKINFVDEKFFMNVEFLNQLIKYCKKIFKLKFVFCVTNDNKISQKWFVKYDEYLNIMIIFCDSFDETTNIKIEKNTNTHFKTIMNFSQKCKKYDIMLKINTMMNRYNFQKNMNVVIEKIQFFRWKCFQIFVVSKKKKFEHIFRNAKRFLSTIINDVFSTINTNIKNVLLQKTTILWRIFICC